MNITKISDRNLLIAEYTLGLLNLQEVSHAQALLGEDSQAAISALKWEDSFLELVDLLPPVHPGPQSLHRLQAALGHAPAPVPVRPIKLHVTAKPEDETLTVAAALRTPEKTAEIAPIEPVVTALPPRVKVSDPKPPKPGKDPAARGGKNSIWVWQVASAVFALIATVLALTPAKPVAPPVTVIKMAPTRAAILQAPGQSSTPGWVVTVDPQGNVLMNPQVRSDIPGDASVQLWTHSKNAPQPRSLGLIDPNQSVTVPASLMGELASDQIFEMTQEPVGGSTSASPSGPILFIGRIVTFGQAALTPPADDAPAAAQP